MLARLYERVVVNQSHTLLLYKVEQHESAYERGVKDSNRDLRAEHFVCSVVNVACEVRESDSRYLR